MALGLADPALVVNDQPDRDAGAMLGIGPPENGDFGSRAGNFGNRDIAPHAAAIERKCRRHDGNASSAVGEAQQGGAKVACAGMEVLASALAAAERRVDEEDSGLDVRRQSVMNKLGIVGSNIDRKSTRLNSSH